MDVKLPNGVIIKNVPEGTSKQAIAMKAVQSRVAKPEDFGWDPREKATSDSDFENFLAGAGSGLTSIGRKATNLVLPDSMTPDWASDEAIAEQARMDEELMDTKAGMGGRVVGEIAATLPVGGAVGAVGKGLAATRGLGAGGRVLGKALQRGAPRAVVEGGAVGAVMADPDNRGVGAALGAGLGGTLSKAGSVLGKTLGSGMVKITKEADELQKLTGQFIPLSQSAEAGLTKQFYNAFLANLPGVGGKIRGQYQSALDDLRRFAGEHAMPDTPDAHTLVNLTGKETVEEMVAKLENYWTTAFDGIKKIPLRTFKDANPVPNAELAKLIQKSGFGTIKIPGPGVKFTGADFLTLKTTLGEISASQGAKARSLITKYQKQLDHMLERNLDPYGKGRGAAAKALNDYRAAQNKWGTWQSFRKAAEAAKDNQHFSPSQIAKAGTNTELAAGAKGPVQRAGELGVTALENFPSRQGLFQTLAASGPVLSAGAGWAAAGASGAGLALLGAIGTGRLFASKGLQKFLSGQTKGQRLNKALMKKYSTELKRLGMTGRDIAVVLGVGNAS